MVNDAAFRLHAFHCAGCPEYGSHGGEWKKPEGVGGSRPPEANAGFDSPPPPSRSQMIGEPHVHGVECYGC